MPYRYFLGAISILVVTLGILLVVTFIYEPTTEEPPAGTPEETPATPLKQHSVIGTSVEGRPLEVFQYGTGDTHVLFVGGIHGGYEWNSVLLAYEFMDHLDAHPEFVPDHMTISVIPSANPDGLFTVIGKEGRFTIDDVPNTKNTDGTGRFNARNVDLNRNFDCKWQPESTWRGNVVSAGTEAFSEPEAAAIRDFVRTYSPDAAVFWHSKASAVYASECTSGILPQTLVLMNTYADAAHYTAVPVFDAYPVTGDAEGWLASIGVPAITVELGTHETIEWDQNLAGISALLKALSGTSSGM